MRVDNELSPWKVDFSQNNIHGRGSNIGRACTGNIPWWLWEWNIPKAITGCTS